MANLVTIDRFNAYHTVFMQRAKEHEQGTTDKAYAAYAFGRMIGAYECLTFPLPADIGPKYSEACAKAAQHNIP